MDPVIVALGSNVGDRRRYMSDARGFLEEISEKGLRASSLWMTEPVGPSTRYFLNAAVEIHSSAEPETLVRRFKRFEKAHGRSAGAPRWSARTIDLDIISWGNLVIQHDTLIIPHAEYRNRLFVLEPLRELRPEWKDPETRTPVDELIARAPDLSVRKLNATW
ncbi:MAG: 2-amino-4-hydroxy-6-hydroxymethyldihydropteridine diphosphokinase [Balneolaceae bacterium]|nr:2-amino-4-hydroxy-6-hydroxymethyldihydropteridine diphosphokinase [Balneolaceae bacterium]